MEKITNYEVTDQEIKEKGVQAVQGEVLYGDPAENKRLFDRLVTFVIGKYNAALEWLVDKAHVHENSELLDSLVEENAHSHGNKALLDSVEEKNVHEHWNKETLDGVNKNLIAAWNMSAGVTEWGGTDLDCGEFPEGLMVFQVKRGAAASAPELANGEFGLADGDLLVGTTDGNMLLVSERNLLEEETIQVAKETGFLPDDSGGNTGGDTGDTGGNTGGGTGGDSGGGDETDPDAYGFQGTGGQTMKLTKPANITVVDIEKDAAGNIIKYVNSIIGKVAPEDGVYSFGFTMSAGMNTFSPDSFVSNILLHISILNADESDVVTMLNYGGYDAASETITLNVPENNLNTNTSYVLEFGADVYGNDSEKILGVPITFTFTTKI